MQLFDRSITIKLTLFQNNLWGVGGDRQPNHRRNDGLAPTLRRKVGGLYTLHKSPPCIDAVQFGQLQQVFN